MQIRICIPGVQDYQELHVVARLNIAARVIGPGSIIIYIDNIFTHSISYLLFRLSIFTRVSYFLNFFFTFDTIPCF